MYTIIEHGPDGETRVGVRYCLKDARKAVNARRNFWKDAVEINKAPKRTWTIRIYLQIGALYEN